MKVPLLLSLRNHGQWFKGLEPSLYVIEEDKRERKYRTTENGISVQARCPPGKLKHYSFDPEECCLVPGGSVNHPDRF